MAVTDLLADGVQEVSFSEPYPAVEEEWIVAR